MSFIDFAHVVVDCAKADQLARFYAALLDRTVADNANEFFAFIPGTPKDSYPGLMFIQVPESRAGKNRLHIDLVSDDRRAAVARAVGLGATHVADFDEYGAVWTTLSDPEGNVFDIAAR